MQLFTTDLFVPRYVPVASGDWQLSVGDLLLCPGYWSGPMVFDRFAALARDGATWMSISPMELESQEIGIRAAHGHVLIAGLGMGWAAAATAMLPQVTRVTVVELDHDVLAIHRALDLFAQLPDAARAKVAIVEDDAFSHVPIEPVDLLMPDIWLPLVNDGRLDEVRHMQENVQAGAVYFWGQELEIARHARAAGRALDDAGVAATVAEFGLPLIGPGTPDYPARIAAAAERWMRGRWLKAVDTVEG